MEQKESEHARAPFPAGPGGSRQDGLPSLVYAVSSYAPLRFLLSAGREIVEPLRGRAARGHHESLNPAGQSILTSGEVKRFGDEPPR